MKSNEFSVVVEGEVRQSAQGRKPCRCDNCRHILVSGPNRILRIHSIVTILRHLRLELA